MLDNINDRLVEIRKKKNHIEHLNSTLEELKEKSSTKKLLRKKMKYTHEEAFIDYQKINSFTLTSIYYTILGKKKEKLNKDKQKYLSAKLNLERLEEELELIKNQFDETQLEISKSQNNVEPEYQEVLKEKEEYLLLKNELEGKELKSVINKMREIDLELEVYNESLEILKQIIKGLNQVYSKLESANKFKGGFITTAIKHAKQDGARKHYKRVENDMYKFMKKIKTVDTSIGVIKSIDIGELSTFDDHFIDAIKYGDVDNNNEFLFRKEDEKTMNDVHFLRKRIFRIKGKLLDKVKLKQNDKENLNLERIKLLL